jgi:hypothetical protein
MMWSFTDLQHGIPDCKSSKFVQRGQARRFHFHRRANGIPNEELVHTGDTLIMPEKSSNPVLLTFDAGKGLYLQGDRAAP